MKYEMLLDEADSENIRVIENAKFKSRSDGLINGNVIGINRNVRSTRKRACILAEEIGHYCTTVGNILDQSDAGNRKQEFRARLWAYDKLIGLDGIINAYQHGCENLSETAEYLEVTEEFLIETLHTYKNKYGAKVEYGDYVVSFIPYLKVNKK